MKNIKFPFYAQASLICIGIFAFATMLFIGRSIIVPLIYSTIIAMVLSPAVKFLVRKGLNRGLAISLILLLLILISILFITVLSSQMIQLSESFPQFIEKFDQLMKQSTAWASENFNISPRKINSWIAVRKAEMLSGSSSAIGQTLINTGNVLVVLVLIPVYVFMILYYQPLLVEFIHKLFKSANHGEVNNMLTSTKKIIQSYLVGLLLEAAIVATLNSATLLLLGIDYAILLGVLGAILNVIPYLGGLIAVALPMMVALATKESSSYSLLVLAAYFVIQLIDNNYIIPKVVASKVKINALISIIVVIIGGALWGIPGMFLSIPLTAVIKLIFDNIESLKPWGYLLGDTMPPFLGLKFPFKTLIPIVKSNK